MGEIFNRIRTQISDFYASLSKTKRFGLIGGGVAFVLIVTILILTLTRTSYVVLAQGVSLEESGAITTKLDELGIKWRDENATTILVDKTQLSKAKITLAVEGIVNQKDFTWTDAFATNSMTMTSEEKGKMFLRAKASALEEAIEFLEPIETAIVELYTPNESTYLINDDSKSKASVILKVRNNMKLTEAQVNGIVMILVNSVKDLEASNVSIIDNSGLELNKSGDYNDDSYIVSSQFDLQNVVEKRLQDRLTEFLSSIYGASNIKVMTTVLLDFDSQETISKVFSPPIEGEVTGMLRSISEITEDVKNGVTASGAPGTDSNIEATNYAEVTSDGSNYSKASKTLNYELNEINTQISKARGTVKDISIGIIINTDSLVDNELTDAHKEEVKSLVSAAAGLDTRIVEVQSRKFADPYENFDLTSSGDVVNTGVPIWLFLVILAVVLVIAAYAFMTIRKRNKRRDELHQLELEEQKQGLEEISMDNEDQSSPKYQIEKFIDSNPEAVAQLLRAWINED